MLHTSKLTARQARVLPMLSRGTTYANNSAVMRIGPLRSLLHAPLKQVQQGRARVSHRDLGTKVSAYFFGLGHCKSSRRAEKSADCHVRSEAQHKTLHFWNEHDHLLLRTKYLLPAQALHMMDRLLLPRVYLSCCGHSQLQRHGIWLNALEVLVTGEDLPSFCCFLPTSSGGMPQDSQGMAVLTGPEWCAAVGVPEPQSWGAYICLVAQGAPVEDDFINSIDGEPHTLGPPMQQAGVQLVMMTCG
jgi:hypothetical protein